MIKMGNREKGEKRKRGNKEKEGFKRKETNMITKIKIKIKIS